ACEAFVTRETVFTAAGSSLPDVRARRDRGTAVATAMRGVIRIVQEAHSQGDLSGIMGLGGSAGTTIGTAGVAARSPAASQGDASLCTPRGTRGSAASSVVCPQTTDAESAAKTTQTQLTRGMDRRAAGTEMVCRSAADRSVKRRRPFRPAVRRAHMTCPACPRG
ncbi:MAG: hypothetical protein D6725_07850, partial [Planctomycetota bacterium]